jgi:hypothetical protein
MPRVWPTPLSRVAKFGAGADVERSVDLEEGGLDGADGRNCAAATSSLLRPAATCSAMRRSDLSERVAPSGRAGHHDRAVGLAPPLRAAQLDAARGHGRNSIPGPAVCAAVGSSHHTSTRPCSLRAPRRGTVPPVVVVHQPIRWCASGRGVTTRQRPPERAAAWSMACSSQRCSASMHASSSACAPTPPRRRSRTDRRSTGRWSVGPRGRASSRATARPPAGPDPRAGRARALPADPAREHHRLHRPTPGRQPRHDPRARPGTASRPGGTHRGAGRLQLGAPGVVLRFRPPARCGHRHAGLVLFEHPRPAVWLVFACPEHCAELIAARPACGQPAPAAAAHPDEGPTLATGATREDLLHERGRACGSGAPTAAAGRRKSAVSTVSSRHYVSKVEPTEVR